MKTTLYFYTGSGNSLWTARTIADLLGNTQLVPIACTAKETVTSPSDCIGLIFPVHIWGIPSPVIDFARRLENDPTKYYFAVAVNAGQVAASLIQMQKLLRDRSITMGSGFSIDLPSNYIPWGGAISEDKQKKKFSAAMEKFKQMCALVQAQKEVTPEKGPLWQNIILSFFYRKSFPHVPKMDKSFFADDKCNDCTICAKICPAQNIVMAGRKPAWQHRCEQCFACIQWCPQAAIQYGKNTTKKKRYHHPEIKLQDMLSCVPGKNS